MIENLALSIEVVAPLVLFMALGFTLKRWIKLKDESLAQMNKLVYSVFLPLTLFRTVYATDLNALFDMEVILYAVISLLLYFAVLFFIVPKIEKDPRNCSVMIQGSYRSNHALFGLTVVTAIFGDTNLGMAGILSAIVIILFNFLAILLFEAFQKEKPNIKDVCKKTAVGCAKNPLIIALVAGLLFLAMRTQIPTLQLSPVIEKTIKDLAGIATPLALLVLGATFQFDDLRKYVKQICFVAVARLVVIPVLFLIPAALLLGVRDVNLVVLMSMYGAPTAVSSFPMAVALGGNGKLAGLLVVVTSIFSVITVFLWIFVLGALGWIVV